jgi:integrase
VLQALSEHRQQQNERRARLGELWHDPDLVFTIANGKPIHPDSVQHDFRRLVRLAGVPYIRIHDLRHTFVTLAYRHGASIKAISETVGHAGIGITLEVYAHLVADQRREVADTLGAALFGTVDGTQEKRGDSPQVPPLEH